MTLDAAPRARRTFDAAAPLAKAEIVLCVGGGIAAYKACELTRLFTRAGASVQVVMTRRAQKFVGPLTFGALTGRPVFTDLFDLTQESEIGHIQVADRADLVVVAPATANLIARMAAGGADDVVSAVCLATRAPVLLAPSMNVNMWQHPLTQANVRRLVDVAGARVVGPGDGFLACRWVGPGRLAEPADIAEAACRVLAPQDLAGRRVVVTAGPTHEPIDPVRFLGNRSSGKMGYAIAAAAARRGAQVTLVAGPTSLADPVGLEVVHVEDARAMGAALDRTVWTADVVVMAAAVADFRPRAAAERKLKRTEIGHAPALELESNPDLLAGLGATRKARGAGPLLVGFAAETHDVVAYARGKLAAKGCDLVVANDVTAPGAGFAVDTNHVTLVEAGATTELAKADKATVAHRIWDRVVELLAAGPPRGAGPHA
ncbi:MAG TPA: bifunctional phosphopantothenoylcysteine decarboxylase/phosphopantothenate--cysteine ligase CoaBC [Kofleriaceae bacterium]|nr:bifunctional phosphopantothenoylcysteine decarboxylase/phosphopantothenate--cysteine ligase CoaBC [Kofleriaceae bacterium]